MAVDAASRNGSVKCATGAEKLLALPRLPASRTTPSVETGDYYNLMTLRLEEYAVRKAPHPRAATVAVNNGELRWMFRDCFNRGFDC